MINAHKNINYQLIHYFYLIKYNIIHNYSKFNTINESTKSSSINVLTPHFIFVVPHLSFTPNSMQNSLIIINFGNYCLDSHIHTE